MMSSTPVCAVKSPRKGVRDLRLRGIPAHIADALSKLESSVGSSDNSDVKPDTSPADTTFTTRIYSLTTRLLEFVKDAQQTKEDNGILRKNLQEVKQKSEEKEDTHLREITKIKIKLDESNNQIGDLHNDLELSNATIENLRERVIEHEKDKLSLQRKSQNFEDQCRSLANNLQKILLEKKEIKESRDIMEVELASERNRNNHLANELQQALQQIERSKTHNNETTGFAVPQECLSCVKRRSLEEQFKQKIQCLETELETSRKDALESEKKLQALAEELRKRVLEEKVRAQKLARRNSQLAAERLNANQQLNAFEEVLNKAHSKTFHGDVQDESHLNDAVLIGDETMSREMAILRRLGVFPEGDATFNGITQQNRDTLGECPTM
ncbi:protein CROWDED NUCLEI 2 [Galendromus occidentalis]|uniref:Protein CROWDED NUCLEI 2 n=1 Tax=Galendromus occidentalis TaxID=34638 RepID=A0AAJ6QLT0_9ACAR|nr:protein CROWDED NUCLEI 2 [Galendromus occidentalis]